MLDMWHMKGSRTAPLGFVDDQYTDDTRFDAQKSPNAGRKSDPGDPEYANLKVVTGRPEFMNKDGKPANAVARTTSSRVTRSCSTMQSSRRVTKWRPT
jgi:hypothetical protein